MVPPIGSGGREWPSYGSPDRKTPRRSSSAEPGDRAAEATERNTCDRAGAKINEWKRIDHRSPSRRRRGSAPRRRAPRTTAEYAQVLGADCLLTSHSLSATAIRGAVEINDRRKVWMELIVHSALTLVAIDINLNARGSAMTGCNFF